MPKILCLHFYDVGLKCHTHEKPFQISRGVLHNFISKVQTATPSCKTSDLWNAKKRQQLHRKDSLSYNNQGCQMVYFCKPEIPIWVNFGGSCNGRCWYILWPFCQFYIHLIYFMAIWYIYSIAIW
jgi:hypothetical protein